MSSLNIHTVSCFEINLKNSVSRGKGFTVCIDNLDRNILLNPDNWARGIVIKPWKFYPDRNLENASRGDGKNDNEVGRETAMSQNWDTTRKILYSEDTAASLRTGVNEETDEHMITQEGDRDQL